MRVLFVHAASVSEFGPILFPGNGLPPQTVQRRRPGCPIPVGNWRDPVRVELEPDAPIKSGHPRPAGPWIAWVVEAIGVHHLSFRLFVAVTRIVVLADVRLYERRTGL